MFDRLAKAKHFTEHEARVIMKQACCLNDVKYVCDGMLQIAEAIFFLHSHNIAHRYASSSTSTQCNDIIQSIRYSDLKPENLLYKSTVRDTPSSSCVKNMIHTTINCDLPHDDAHIVSHEHFDALPVAHARSLAQQQRRPLHSNSDLLHFNILVICKTSMEIKDTMNFIKYIS